MSPMQPCRPIEVVATQVLSQSMRRITFRPDTPQTDGNNNRNNATLAFSLTQPAQALKLFVPDGRDIAARAYTVRGFNPVTGEFDIDFALGASGPASAWAAQARPGATLQCGLPRGGFQFSADTDWYLLIGDETALPAIAAIVEAMPAGTPALAMIEMPTADDRQEFNSNAFLLTQWFSREERWTGPGLCLEETLESLAPRRSRGRVWIAGEAERVRQLRTVAQQSLRIDAADISVSGYWKYGVAAHGGNE